MLYNIDVLETFLADIGTAAYDLGHEAYIVGGYVRDQLYSEFNNKPSPDGKDIDLVINTDAIEFIHRYQRFMNENTDDHHTFEIIEEFPSFGTVKFVYERLPGYEFEFASTRKESYAEPAAFPKVEIIEDIKEDLSRRDFTINAILMSIMPMKYSHNYGEFIDHINGIKDLQEGLVRVFHDDSCIDDPTRIFRAARFMAEYNFKIEPYTLSLIKQAAQDTRMPQWLEKRKNRFAIELENINKLGGDKSASAREFLVELGFHHCETQPKQ